MAMKWLFIITLIFISLLLIRPVEAAWTIDACILYEPESDPNIQVTGTFNILVGVTTSGSAGGYDAPNVHARYCSGAPCSPTTDIPASDGLSTPTNPQNCGNACKNAEVNFTFTVTGNTAGTYTIDGRCESTIGDLNTADQDATVTAPSFVEVYGVTNGTYPVAEIVYCSGSEACTLWRNGINVTAEENNTQVTLPAGLWNYTASISDNASTVWNEIIQNTTTLGLAINGTEGDVAQPYPYPTNVTGWNCPAQLLCILERNGTQISNPDETLYGAEKYNFTYYNTTGNENYTSHSVTRILTINKGSTTTSVSPTTQTISYPTTVTQYCTSDHPGAACSLWRGTSSPPTNNITDQNNTVEALPPGTWYLNATTPDTENYSGSSSAVQTITVNQGPTEMALYLNDTRSDKTYTQYEIANFTAQLNVTGQLINLTSNMTGWITLGSESSRIENATNLTTIEGFYMNATFNNSNANYTDAYETWYVTVQEPVVEFVEVYGVTNGTYPQPETVYCSGSEACTLWRNGTNVTAEENNTQVMLAAGLWNYTASISTSAKTVWNNITRNETSLGLAINGTEGDETYTYPNVSNVTSWDCPAQINCVLERNGTPITSPDIMLYGAEDYNFTYYTDGNENYTSNSTTRTLVINKADPSPYLKLVLNDTEDNVSVVYPNVTNATGWFTKANQDLTFNLYRNDSLEDSGNPANELLELFVSMHPYVYNTSGGSNYTAGSSPTRFVNVSEGTPSISVTFSANSVVYPTLTIAYCNITSKKHGAKLDLYRNGSLADSGSGNRSESVLLGTAAYNYTCVYNKNQNYTQISNSNNYLAVQQNSTNLVRLFLNGSEDNLTVAYPTSTNATGAMVYSNSGILLLWRNGTSVPNQEITILGNETHEYKLNTSGNQNYSANHSGTAYYIFVNKGPTLTRLFLNDTEENRRYIINDTANFTATLNVSGKTIYLDSNITGWVLQSSATPLVNYTNLTSEGVYNMTVYFPGEANYSASSQTYYATVIGSYLETDLVEPTGTELVREGMTFFLNSLITCRIGNCGSINATPRYNGIPMGTSGNLYLKESAIKNCTLDKDQSCYANWTVYTSLGTWAVDVNASDTVSNETGDATVSVYRVVTEVVEVPAEGFVTRKPLLDLEITDLTTSVIAGKDLVYTINLTNIGYNTTFDAVIHKRIKKDNETLVEDAVTVSMTSGLLVTDHLDIPPDLEPGRYFFELFIEYVGREALAIATFDVEKVGLRNDCLTLSGTSFDVLKNRLVFRVKSLRNVVLKFDNMCGIQLTNPTLYLDGRELKISAIPLEGFEIAADFDKYGLHNATVLYSEGSAEIEFYLQKRGIGIYIIISIFVIALTAAATATAIAKLKKLAARESETELFKQALKEQTIEKIKKKFKEGGFD